MEITGNMRIDAIVNLYPAMTMLDGEGFVDATDNSGNVIVLDESAIATEVARLQGLYDALDYSRQRKAKYDLLNQYEMIGDDATNGTTTHKDAIAAIKPAHPKP